MNDLTLITCSYNTPDIILTMLKSFHQSNNTCDKLVIIENSTNDETAKILKENNIPFYVPGTRRHSEGVQAAFDICTTKYALLVDTDIIFKKDVDPVLKQCKENDISLLGEVCGNRGGRVINTRIHPWFCFINIDNIKKYNIKFWDSRRFGNGYDVGCSFFEDIRKNGLNVGDIKMDPFYYTHYEGMSWRTQTYDPTKPDTGIDNGGTHPFIEYFNAGNRTKRIYDSETAYLRPINIKNIFK